MQTFLPVPDFAESAAVLDRQRLGKQRVETLQILKALDKRTPDSGWSNHPAVKMWTGYPFLLVEYGLAICTEWIRRGYRDSCYEKIYEFKPHGLFVHYRDHPSPFWLGSWTFHRSHQSNLVRKDPAHYRQYFPDVPDNLDYVWPTSPLPAEPAPRLLSEDVVSSTLPRGTAHT